MSKKTIYTLGYTLFQKGNIIDIESLFQYLQKYDIKYLVDVRSVPYSKQYPQCNADKMKVAGKYYGIPYINMLEIGAKPNSLLDVFSTASDIFSEEVFPISKSNRPEKTELVASDEIVDFHKFRCNECFLDGLKRIEKAYENDYTLCLMCSESDPVDCHRYYLIGKALEMQCGDWLEVKHIVKNNIDELCTVSNADLNEQLIKIVFNKDVIKRLNVLTKPIFGTSCLDKCLGETQDDKINDFCDRYWNLIHGWKRYDNVNNNEIYD